MQLHNYYERIHNVGTWLIFLFWVLASMTSCRSAKQSVVGGVRHPNEIVRLHKGDALHKAIASEACTWLGTPYAYARSEKGVGTDCSGMVMQIYDEVAGRKIPRNSARQAEFCKKLKPEEVETGDLVFFATGKDPDRISHVGIMLDEESFIHASTSKGVVISKINTPYYTRTFKGFGRAIF